MHACDRQGLTALDYAVGKRHHVCVLALSAAMGTTATAAEAALAQVGTCI